MIERLKYDNLNAL